MISEDYLGNAMRFAQSILTSLGKTMGIAVYLLRVGPGTCQMKQVEGLLSEIGSVLPGGLSCVAIEVFQQAFGLSFSCKTPESLAVLCEDEAYGDFSNYCGMAFSRGELSEEEMRFIARFLVLGIGREFDFEAMKVNANANDTYQVLWTVRVAVPELLVNALSQFSFQNDDRIYSTVVPLSGTKIRLVIRKG